MLIANRQSCACDGSLFQECTQVFVETTSEYTKAGIGITYREDVTQPSIIDWGDGTIQSIDGDIDHAVHDYGVPGNFTIKLSNLSAFSLGTLDMTWRMTTSQDYYTVKKCIIGTTVKRLLHDAFIYANSLSSILIPNSMLSIDDSTFVGVHCNEIIIPDSVRYIGPWVFYNNTSQLTNVVIPDTVYMPNFGGTFCDCNVLEKCTYPSTISSIGEYAFCRCYKLQSVYIPSSIVSSDTQSFNGCSRLSCINIDDLSSWCNIFFKNQSSHPTAGHGLYIDGQLVADLSIPSGIKEIKDYAFCNCGKSTSLEIPDTVSSIGQCAFYNCSELSNTSFGNNITSIGSQAFYNCFKLSSLYLPESLLSIGPYAFGYCQKIQNARIPNGCVSSIGQYAFTNLTSLDDMLFHGLATYEISALPNYPWGVSTSRLSAMHGDAAHAHVTYVDSTTARFKIIGELKANDIANLQNAANIVVYDGLISVAPSAFANCTNLVYVDFPQTLSAVGQNAFTGCSNLQSLTFRKKTIDKIQSMENYPWGIVNESIINGLQPTIAKFIDGTISAYGVDVITQDLIQPASDVVEISVSRDVTDISSQAFRNFINLSSVTMNEGLTCIDRYAFAGCSSLTSLDVPNGVVNAGAYTFASCFSLVSASLPDTLTITETALFRLDKMLNYVKMPNHMSSLGNQTFMSCISLISCEIPVGLTSINAQTFGTCSNLTQAIIPYTVKNIAANAFVRCFSLSSLTCYALSAPTIAATVFGNTATTYAGLSVTGPKTLHVPTGATGYEESYWLSNLLNPDKCGFTISYEDELLSPFLTKIEFADGDLSTLNISEQVKTLYDYTEQWWDDNIGWTKWMTKIEIGNQFTTIQESTFYELTTLTDVKIPYSVTVCEEDAFVGCTGLTSIVVEGKTIDEAKKMLEGTGIPANCQITVT